MVVDVMDLLPEEVRWRAREVRYVGGAWEAVKSTIPDFELADFSVAADGPTNPFLRTVIRRPLTRTERPMPVGVVSPSYSLVGHRLIGEECFEGLAQAGIDTAECRCEVGLSELGEWMNLRVYFPEDYSFRASDGHDMALRLEVFNTVDGSGRLVVLFGWYRFVCSNGLVIGESIVEFRDVHDARLDVTNIVKAIKDGARKVKKDTERLNKWQEQPVSIERIREWANEHVTKAWGKKAACRAYHICSTGHDVELVPPFEDVSASDKSVKQLDAVPGTPPQARTVYDVAQAMAWIATQRNNAIERTKWQTQVALLISKLAA